MENVSKALIIAAGVLIAIIVLSLFLAMYSRMSSISKTQEEVLKQSQLQEFNEQYEAYNRQVMYGVDVITLSNKVDQNNIDNPREKIDLYINNEKITKPSNSGNSIQIVDNQEVFTVTYNSNVEPNFDKTVFRCASIKYDNKTGKVNKIYIVKK